VACADTKSRSERYPRGSLPPYIRLADAIGLAQKVYEQGGGQASYDLMSQLTGNSTSSSAFVKKIAALKAYGLLTEQEKGKVALSERGFAIAAPRSPEGAAAAKKDCFVQIEVFSRVYERHKGKLVPADEFLKNIIEQDCGIPRDLSDSWVSAFKEGARTADLLFDRGDGKVQIMESPVISTPPPSESTGPQLPDLQPRPTAVQKTEEGLNLFSFGGSGHNTRIEVSGQRYAVFSIPDKLTARDAQKIKSALSGLGAIIDSMVLEEES